MNPLGMCVLVIHQRGGWSEGWGKEGACVCTHVRMFTGGMENAGIFCALLNIYCELCEYLFSLRQKKKNSTCSVPGSVKGTVDTNPRKTESQLPRNSGLEQEADV